MTWNIKIRGSMFIAILFIIVTLSIITYLFGTTEDYSDVFTAKSGELEFTRSDLDYAIPLRGEWLYYENQLIFPDSKNAIATTAVIPHTWNGASIGTYQLRIIGLTSGEQYGIYAMDNSSAFSVYADEKLIGRNGKVGTDFESEVHHWDPRIMSFTADDRDVVITIQLSNFHSYPGGFYRDMRFGKLGKLIEHREKKIINQVLLLGGILIMALYNLSLHLLNRKEQSAMYFGLFNLVVALRIVLTGERLINGWISNPSWPILLMIQFLTGASMLVTFALFIQALFPEVIHKGVTKGVIAFGCLMCLPIFVYPIAKLAFLDLIFLIGSLAYFAYLIYALTIAIKRSVEGSIFSLIGILFISGSILLDAVFPPGTNIIPLGIFVFIILQSLVIAEKYSFLVEENIKLQNIATRDGMTNLYKKGHFIKLVKDFVFNDPDPMTTHSMMFVDIDDFKNINDNFGHDVGDEVIKSIAEKLLRSLRYSDIACRFGGDEFVIWLPNAKVEDVEQIASRILEHIAEPLEIGNESISLSASIGASFYPDDARDVDALLVSCDQRMYLAKSEGKNRYSLSDKS